jgi:hypothetical protein
MATAPTQTATAMVAGIPLNSIRRFLDFPGLSDGGRRDRFPEGRFRGADHHKKS